MKIISTSYCKAVDHSDPDEWLDRISFYTGILEELSSRNKVISFERIEYEGELMKNGVQYKFLRFNHKIDRFPRKMHRMIKAINPDIVLVNGLAFPMQILQLRRYIRPGAKVFVLHRAERPGKGIQRFLQRKADHLIDAYLFSSREIGMHWHKAGIIKDPEKIRQIMQNSSVFRGYPHTDADPSKPSFLWVGRLDRNKDPFTLINAFRRFAEKIPAATLRIVYQTDELLPELKELAGDIPQIEWVGKIDHQQLENYYRSSDFIVSTSHYEGVGIAVLEAMSMGCIPILSNIDSFRAMTMDGKCGILFPKADPDELFEAMNKAVRLDLHRTSAEACRIFEDEHSFKAIAEKIEGLANSLYRKRTANALPG